jgi:hypothetical protein
MKSLKGKTVINILMYTGVILTIFVAAIVTHRNNGYTPSARAWFITLIIPTFLMIVVTAYYNEKEPYKPTAVKEIPNVD